MKEQHAIDEMLEGLRSSRIDERRYAAGWFMGEATWHGSIEVKPRDLNEIIELLVSEDDKEVRRDLARGVAAAVRYEKSYNLEPLYRYFVGLVQDAKESREPLEEVETGSIVSTFAYSSDRRKKDIWDLLKGLDDDLIRDIGDPVYELKCNLED